MYSIDMTWYWHMDMDRISLLVFLLWMVISCVFDTTVRNIENLQYDIYFSFMVAAAMELPADLLRQAVYTHTDLTEVMWERNTSHSSQPCVICTPSPALSD